MILLHVTLPFVGLVVGGLAGVYIGALCAMRWPCLRCQLSAHEGKHRRDVRHRRGFPLGRKLDEVFSDILMSAWLPTAGPGSGSRHHRQSDDERAGATSAKVPSRPAAFSERPRLRETHIGVRQPAPRTGRTAVLHNTRP